MVAPHGVEYTQMVLRGHEEVDPAIRLERAWHLFNRSGEVRGKPALINATVMWCSTAIRKRNGAFQTEAEKQRIYIQAGMILERALTDGWQHAKLKNAMRELLEPKPFYSSE